MDYNEIMHKVLCYVDDNISSDLSPDILSSFAGFSTYHFCRVFQWNVGFSVMEYVRLRRLEFAVSELSSGRKLIEIAMDYGFETHSGFTKAFKRHYGVSPETYRMHARSEKPPLPDLVKMNQKYSVGGIIMEPKIVTLSAIKIAGYKISTKNMDNQNQKDIPAFWHDYYADGRAEKLFKSGIMKKPAEFGACFPVKMENGEFNYVIGVEILENIEIPKEFEQFEIPPATYAVFSTPPSNMQDFTKNIQGTWQYIMNEWFPKSGCEYAFGCVDFEYYDEKCMGENDKVCDIYIPIIKK